MIAWIAARSVSRYGESRLQPRRTALILGPLQIEAMIDQTRRSRALTLWDQRGLARHAGQSARIPIGQSSLRRAGVPARQRDEHPQLKRVIVGDGSRLAMEATLADALQSYLANAIDSGWSGGRARHASDAREAWSEADQALRAATGAPSPRVGAAEEPLGK